MNMASFIMSEQIIVIYKTIHSLQFRVSIQVQQSETVYSRVVQMWRNSGLWWRIRWTRMSIRCSEPVHRQTIQARYVDRVLYFPYFTKNHLLVSYYKYGYFCCSWTPCHYFGQTELIWTILITLGKAISKCKALNSLLTNNPSWTFVKETPCEANKISNP